MRCLLSSAAALRCVAHPRGQNGFADDEIFRPCHFNVLSTAFDHPDRIAHPFHEKRIVRRGQTFGLGLPMRLLEPISTEGLRLLRPVLPSFPSHRAVRRHESQRGGLPPRQRPTPGGPNPAVLFRPPPPV